MIKLIKRKAKRAFTLIELVVVIAVIAILGGVAVAAYFGITNNAKESADEQAVTQMNTILLANEIENGPTDLIDMFQVLNENGLDVEDYKPLYQDRYFFWDKETNIVLYTDNEYNVLFPEDNAGENIKSKSTIYSLTGQIAEEKVTIEEKGTVSISSAGEYVSFINQAKDNSANKGSYTINLTSDINLMGADSSLGEIKDADITINGNNHTISGSYAADYVYHEASGSVNPKQYNVGLIGSITDSNVTIKDLTIENASIGLADYNAGSMGILVGQFIANSEESSLTIDNVKIVNSNVYGKNKVGSLVGAISGSKEINITVTNTTFENVNVYSAEGEVGSIFGTVRSSGENTIKIDETTVNSAKSNVNASLVDDGHRTTYEFSSNEIELSNNESLKGEKEKVSLGVSNKIVTYLTQNFEPTIENGFTRYRFTEAELFWYGSTKTGYYDDGTNKFRLDYYYHCEFDQKFPFNFNGSNPSA